MDTQFSNQDAVLAAIRRAAQNLAPKDEESERSAALARANEFMLRAADEFAFAGRNETAMLARQLAAAQ